MNAPTPSSRRHVASPADSAAHAPALVSLARDARAAANDDAVTAVSEHAVNPLWMITQTHCRRHDLTSCTMHCHNPALG